MLDLLFSHSQSCPIEATIGSGLFRRYGFCTSTLSNRLLCSTAGTDQTITLQKGCRSS
jgi:hypothetical protein